MANPALPEIGPDKSLLLVDDDEPFLRRLAKAMEKRGFEIENDRGKNLSRPNPGKQGGGILRLSLQIGECGQSPEGGTFGADGAKVFGEKRFPEIERHTGKGIRRG